MALVDTFSPGRDTRIHNRRGIPSAQRGLESIRLKIHTHAKLFFGVDTLHFRTLCADVFPDRRHPEHTPAVQFPEDAAYCRKELYQRTFSLPPVYRIPVFSAHSRTTICRKWKLSIIIVDEVK